MLALPIHQDLALVRQQSDRIKFSDAVLTVYKFIAVSLKLRITARALFRMLREKALTTNKRVVPIMLKLQAIAEKAAESEDSDSFVEDVKYFINSISNSQALAEDLNKDLGIAIDKISDANQDTLKVLYDTLRILKKYRVQAAKPVDDLANSAAVLSARTIAKVNAS